ncbi:MAG: PepSY-like domain-containing protein [Runella sp.]
MKKVVVFFALLLIASLSFAQKIQEKDVPAAVKTAFQKQYPTAQKVKWEKEKENFEVEFKIGKAETSVLLDSQGNILETETEIAVSELPKNILEYLATQHKGQKIKEAAKITDAKRTLTYEVEIKGKDLIFDEKGNFIKEIKK